MARASRTRRMVAVSEVAASMVAATIVAASFGVLGFGGMAGATPIEKASGPSPAAKQYEKIVATFDKVANQQQAPPTSEVRSVFSSTEKGLRSARWSGRTAKDVKALVADLKTVEPIFEAEAKNSNFSPSKSQKAATEKFLNQAAMVRRDLGLSPTQTGL